MSTRQNPRTATVLRSSGGLSGWVLFVIAILVAGGLYVFGSIVRSPTDSDFGAGWDVPRIGVAITVEPDASLKVQERLRFRAKDEAWNDVFALIAPGKTALVDGIELKNLSSKAIDSEDADEVVEVPSEVYTSVTSDGTDLRVAGLEGYGGSKAEERETALSYRVQRAAVAYDDVVFVRWVVHGAGWGRSVGRLDVSIGKRDGQGGDLRPIRTWIGPAAASQPMRWNEDGTAKVRLGSVPPNVDVSVAALYPRSAFSSSVKQATVVRGDGRALVEAREDRALAESSARRANWVWSHRLPLAGGVVLVAGLLAWLLAWISRGPGRRRKPTSEVFLMPATESAGPRAPEALPPAVAFGLATLRGDEDSLVLATLLDLVNRGYYAGKIDSVWTVEGADGSPVRAARPDDDVDLILQVPASRPSVDGLLDGERAVLAFFDPLLAGRPGALGALRTRVPKEDSDAWSAWRAMTKALERDAYTAIEHERDLRPWQWVIFAAGLLGLVAIWRLGIARSGDARVLIAAVPLLLAASTWPPSHLLRPLTPSGYVRHERWADFVEWTFTASPQDRYRLPPQDWARTLTLSVAFDTLGTLVRTGQIPADAPSDAWWAGLKERPPVFLASSNMGMRFAPEWHKHLAPSSSD